MKNPFLELLVTQSVGPRVISLRLNGGENLFAELPNDGIELPGEESFHFYGGHRLWHAPESFPRTYAPDNKLVHVKETTAGCLVRQDVEADTGMEKQIEINLSQDKPQVVIHHTLINRGLWAVTCAPWAITQMKTGGVAILPQTQVDTVLLPNRSLVLWPYTDMRSPMVQWGKRFIFVEAQMPSPFKVGFPNPVGWLAYWYQDTLFVKRAKYDEHAEYFDYGSSSQCYCNHLFLELETLGPVVSLEPDEAVTHTEIWEVYPDVDKPSDEAAAQQIAEQFIL
ncbi:MAG: hypothetical protein P8046_00140 [Anaerolineales bacterium]